MPAIRMSGEQRREQLLDMTEQLVSETGFHTLSIEAVARAGGVTRPMIYTHFGGLDGLIRAFIDRVSERLIAELAAVLPRQLDQGDPLAALLEATRGYLEVVQANQQTWRLILLTPEGAPDILRERIDLGREFAIAQITEAIRHGFAGGRVSPDPELSARMISAYADDLARLLLRDPAAYPVARLLTHTEWVLRSLVHSE